MDIVRAYIKYLRDVSRKIISRAGFENVLPPETRRRKNFYFNISNSEIVNSIVKNNDCIINYSTDNPYPETNVDIFDYFKKVYNLLDIHSDQKLFLGIGLIHGKYSEKKIAAPLFFAIIDVDQDDHNYILSLNKQSVQINYDFLAKIMNIYLDEEFDEAILSANAIEKYQKIEEVETEVLNSIDLIELLNPTTSFQKLQEVNEFKIISDKTDCKFEYENRNSDLKNELNFYNIQFLFINKVPNELSTYEALNSFLEQSHIKNELLNKLLKNALLEEECDFNVKGDITEEEIESRLKEIPLSLSGKQIEAIKKVWSHGITYIEGPPGTGKSHTITALLILSFLLNKKVLLVSHKKAALDIVKNNVDKLLGENAVLYIGLKGKETRVYLNSILNESDNKIAITNMTREMGNIDSNIYKIIEDIDEVKEQINEDIKLENNFYKTHQEFLKYRDYFKKIYPNQLEDYRFKEDLDNKELKYKKAIKKYRMIKEKTVITRIEIIYRIKLIKHFIPNNS